MTEKSEIVDKQERRQEAAALRDTEKDLLQIVCALISNPQSETQILGESDGWIEAVVDCAVKFREEIYSRT